MWNQTPRRRSLLRVRRPTAVCLAFLAAATAAQPPAIETLRVFNPAPGSVEVDWLTPTAGPSQAPVAHQQLRYAPSPIDDEADWQSATPVTDVPAPTPPGQRQRTLVSGLATGQRYYFRARTHGVDGEPFALSNAVSARVPEPTFFGGYRTAGQVHAEIHAIAQAYPLLAERVVLGETHAMERGAETDALGNAVAGYEIAALRIANDSVTGEKPAFVMVAGQHSREAIVPEVALGLASRLLADYGADPDVTWLVDHQETWIVPLANPDGRWFVELGARTPGTLPHLWRKNANTDDSMPDGCVWPPQVSRHVGTDLNRNFDWQWTRGSDSPCSEFFRGSGPESEPETRAVTSLIRGLYDDLRGDATGDSADPDAPGIFINLHSGARSVTWPWGGTSMAAPDRAALAALGTRMADASDIGSGQSFQGIYPMTGNAGDWAYGELGLATLLYEIDFPFFPPYADVPLKYWPVSGRNRHFEAMMVALKFARAPYRLARMPVAQRPFVRKLDADTWSVSVALEASEGTVTAAELFIADPPWDGAPVLPLTPTDGAFDSPFEIATALLDASQFAPGRQLVYARALGTGGAPGTVTATFVDGDSVAMANVPPVITGSQPDTTSGEPASINAGETARFSVTVEHDDSDPLYYSWLVNGERQTEATGPSFDFMPGLALVGEAVVEVVVGDGLAFERKEWATAVLDTRLVQAVSRWPLDAADGAVAAESTGAGADGELVGEPRRIAGRIGGGLACDGDDDHVLLDAANAIGREEFTLSFWYRNDSAAGDYYEYVLSVGEVARRNSLAVYFLEGSDTLRTVFKDSDDPPGFGEPIDVTARADGEWHLYTLRVDRKAASPVQVFIDGMLAGSRVDIGRQAFEPRDPMFVCARGDRNRDRFYEGDIDDLMIHNRAITSTEVVALHALARPGVDNQPAVITAAQPTPGAFILQSDQSHDFVVQASDPDGAPLDYAWFVDGRRLAVAAEPLLRLDASNFPSGLGRVTALAGDGEAWAGVEWQVEVFVPPNDPPIVSGVSPVSPIVFESGEVLTLQVQAADPEGLPLSYVWTVDGKVMEDATGASVQVDTAALTESAPRIVATISDGNQAVQATFELLRDDIGDDPPLFTSATPATPVLGAVLANLVFEVDVADVDSTALSYRWEVDGQVVGGADTASLSHGAFGLREPLTVVTVFVGDGANEISHSWEVRFGLGIDPVVHLPLDEPGGTVAGNAAPAAAMDATVTGGPERVQGVLGLGLGCDERDDVVRLPAGHGFGGDALTASFWFRDNVVAGNAFEYLFSTGPVNQPDSLNVYFCEAGSACGGKLRTVFLDGNDSRQPFDLDIDGLGDGQWHHYALTVDPTEVNPVKVYIDGTLAVETARSGGDPFDPAGDLFLCGRGDLDQQRYYGGALDDVQLFNVALAADAVQQLHELGREQLNYPPVFDAISPLSPVVYREPGLLTLDVEVHDADGDPLSFTWSLDDVPLEAGGPSLAIDTAALDPAGSTVLLSVSDGEAVATTRWQLVFDDQVYLPTAHYDLDDSADGIVADRSMTNGPDAVLLGDPALVPDATGGTALSCDERDDRLVVPAPAGLSGDAFTVSFALRDTNTAGGAYEYLFSLGQVGTPSSLNVYFCETTSGCDGQLRTLFRSSGDAAGFDRRIDVGGLADGAWHRYTLRVDRADPVPVRVFVDGVQAGSSTALGNGAFNANGDLYLCAREDLNAARYYGGTIDDLRVYDEALPIAVIASGGYLSM